MDARGTGFQSNEFLFSVYRNLGTVEMEDQISVTRQLVNDNISIMDPKRVAIWGWSYGGESEFWDFLHLNEWVT